MIGASFLTGQLRSLIAFEPAEPVIEPYRAQRSVLWSKIRKLIYLSLCIWIGAFYGFFFTVLPTPLLIYLLLPVVVLATVVIWALPEEYAPPTKLLHKLLFVFFGVLVMWPNYLAIALPGLPWISVRRLVAIVLAVVLLICFSVSRDFKSKMLRSLKGAPFIYKAYFGFIVIQFLTLATSQYPFYGLNSLLERQATWTAVFFASAYLFSKPGNVTLWAKMALIMAAILCIVGFAEFRNQQILWANHIPDFLRVGDEAVQNMLASNFRDGRYRVTTTFSVSLSFAEYLALITPFLLHQLARCKNILTQAIWVACDVILLIVIYLTTARLGIVGWITAHVFYLFLWSFKRWRADRSNLLAAALTFSYPAMLAALLIGMTTVPALKNRTIGGGSTGYSDSARKDQFKMAGPKVLANPWGYGINQGAGALNYVTPSGQVTIDSYILSIILDYGIVGFILFYGILTDGIIKSTRVALRTSEDTQHDDEELSYAFAVATALVVFFTTKLVLSQEDNQSVLFMLLGMAAALKARSDADARLPSRGANVDGAAGPRSAPAMRARGA